MFSASGRKYTAAGAGPSPAGWPVVPDPSFEIGTPPFHVWPTGCCIHPILYLKNVALPSWFLAPPGFSLPLLLHPGDGPEQVETFKYLGMVFMSNGSRNKNINTRIDKANAVLRELYCSMVMKRELSKNAAFSF